MFFLLIYFWFNPYQAKYAIWRGYPLVLLCLGAHRSDLGRVQIFFWVLSVHIYIINWFFVRPPHLKFWVKRFGPENYFEIHFLNLSWMRVLGQKARRKAFSWLPAHLQCSNQLLYHDFFKFRISSWKYAKSQPLRDSCSKNYPMTNPKHQIATGIL